MSRLPFLPALPRRAALAGGVALALLATLPAAAVRADDTPVRGGVLKYATLGLDTADPHRHTGSIAVQQAYVEALTGIGLDGGVEPFLAESFEVSPDGRTYRFRIREGVRFHNGRILTAADVLANFERVRRTVKGGWLASAMKLVDSMEAPDDRTFVVRMSEPYAPFLSLISELWILSPASPGWDETITRPIGTGPFTFGTWVPNVKLTAPAFRDYWKTGRPYLDAVEFDLRDSDDRSLALRSGDLHIASVGRDTLPELRADKAITVKSLKDSTWYFVSFNNRAPRPPLDNVRVREAIAHALDKRAFMGFIAGEDGVVTNQMVAPGNVYFDAAQHAADRHAAPDPDKARAILAAEGVDPAKHTLEVVSWQDAYSQVAVQMVKQLGFKVNHVALDDVGAQKRLGQYDWDLAPMASGPRADVFLRYVRLMSDGPNPVLWGGVQDPAFDAAVRAAVAEPDQARRKAHYSEAWQRVIDGYYTVVLGHATNTIANRAEVRGWEPGFTWASHWATGGVGEVWLAPAR
ncbi:ABC transporter substrate-binding protein [Azospirillum halopraeferens]|uniref:ABC transporter substrate-binding protein n=1 Tax=Azospirillum halopraeferens TaxID=34010 RepID=UPI0003FB0A67|nr:ABC transporter substrate-binding protein [Azospirillum halopraeferens]